MTPKSVLVCLKWVSTRTEVHPITGEVTTDDRFSGISAADSSALEWSLMLGAALGASVTAATVGPAAAEAALLDAIACGAGKGVRIATDLSTDRQVTSQQTAEALGSIGSDHQVVVCGDYSTDRGSGSVPVFLAHYLGLPQALGLLHLETEDGQVVATRRLDHGRRERLALKLPAVISVESGLELRRAALSATLSAKTATIETHDLHEVLSNKSREPHSWKSRGMAPYRPRVRRIEAPEGDAVERVQQLAQVGGAPSAAKVVTATPADAADIAIEQLREWGYL